MKSQSIIEPLEPRIAPATLVNPTTVTYIDLDGDAVTVKVSAGTFIFTAPNGGGGNSLTFTAANAGGGQQLKQIFLQSADFSGANLTVSVVKKPGGDGLANVGEIITGRDLGAVSINGDLGDIYCGDAITDTGFGLKSLTVRSMGRFFGSVGGGVGNGDNTLESHIFGTLGKVVVKGDVENIWLHVTGNPGDDAHGIIGSVTIGGSLIGGFTRRAGGIECTGDIGAVKIGRDLQGGTAEAAGYINSVSGKIASITIGGSVIGGPGQDAGGIHAIVSLGSLKIGGSLIGGSGSFSAQIQISGGSINQLKIGGDIVGGSGVSQAGFVSASTIGKVTVGGSAIGSSGRFSGSVFAGSSLLGPVKIGGSVIGGSGNDSGLIGSNGGVGNVTIGGSVIGGTDNGTGGISGGSLGSAGMGVVKIGRDLIGGSILGSTPNLGFSGYIQSGGRIASVTIGGSIISGIDTSTGGDLFNNGSIRAADDIGSLTVKGSLIGHGDTGTGASPVIISARGQALTATSDVAIGRITIGGHAEFASILAGYDTFLAPKNGNAQIGPVKVGGDWIASSLVAGVKDTGAAGFGDASDTIIGGGASIAKIASIVIGGIVIGTPGGGDHFGFVSHQIGSFKSLGFTAPFSATAGEFFDLSPFTDNDVTVREV